MRADVVGLWGAASHEVLLRKHRREILRLRLGDGMRADVVGLWGAASYDGLRMTVSLGGCARMWWGDGARRRTAGY